jgi:integrase
MRDKGEGSLYKRADGRWVAQVEAGRNAKGKRRYLRAVRKTHPEARTALRSLKRERDAGNTFDQRLTVGVFLDMWLDTYLPGRVSSDTIKDYRDIARLWIVPHVGNVKLVKLLPAHIDAMLASLLKADLSPGSANKARSLLRNALRWAEQQGLPRNVAAVAKPLPEPRRKRDDLSASEARSVLTTAEGDRLYALYKLVLTLGLRQGEVLALPWPKVDLEDEELSVEDAKTEAGDRTIPLVAGTLEALRAHRRRQAAERLEAGPLWTDTGLVFTHTDGRPIPDRTVRDWWYRLLKDAGVPRRRFHASRHTAGSLMLDAGVELEVVSAVLGHSKLATTSDIYAKHSADSKRRELRKLEER